MVAIATEDSGFTIIELTSGWDLEVGDVITWANGYGLGFETYENLTQQTSEEVFVQNHDVNISNLRAQLLL
ncbi:hypothetical protein [Lysobacter solisilvae (ex Woo and Kim 2020)]|uniref:Uncharacterized protein n=1 Tax=Agrilutibacter terrestris TaxID=2865112 RepID=A0A7H0FVY8_9GAMM|nr:hypothetical protein [Lysobacter terrestris]QNP40204.1 hypothetical protein H8B22_12005 [Lysobacter terrestris]